MINKYNKAIKFAPFGRPTLASSRSYGSVMHLGEIAMRITVPMYEKGRSFIMAGGLVKAYEGYKYVYLHLLCQGFENIGKAMLLAENYDKYGPLLRSKFGHDLDVLLDKIQFLYGQAFLTTRACYELKEMNKFYKRPQFRYGHDIDFSDTCSGINANHLHREIVDQLEYLNQKFQEINA